MNNNQVLQTLYACAEPSYALFAASLIPNSAKPLLGVRLGTLRRLAHQLVQKHGAAALQQIGSTYFEETMLYGMVTGILVQDTSQHWHFVDDFLPQISDWSVCDSFCAGLKIAKKQPQQVLCLLPTYCHAAHVFTVRFGCVMLLRYFFTSESICFACETLSGIHRTEPYIQSALAWAVAEAYVEFEPQGEQLLRRLFVQQPAAARQAVQKISESRRIDSQAKQRAQLLKKEYL